jgi:hypothetical protein
LTENLVPVISKLPQEAAGMAAQFTDMIQTNPQGMYSMLLSPEAMAKIPPLIAGQILPVLKSALMESLHSVFLLGLAFVILGAILALFVGSIKISERKKERDQEAPATME